MQVLQKDRYHTELNFPSDLPIRRGCCHHHQQKERAQQFHMGGCCILKSARFNKMRFKKEEDDVPLLFLMVNNAI